MTGGRPPKGTQQRYPELEELASWFHRALGDAGYGSVNEFISRGPFEKNAVYGVFNATRFLTLEDTRAVATALRRDSSQVVPIWTRAREARDRAAFATERAQQPRVTSWAEIPMPSLALRDLLEDQCASVDRLPYELLGVREPPLSSVYIRQQVRVRVAPHRSERRDTVAGEPAAEEPLASTRPQHAMSVTDALESHDHILVTGEPGAGKSTMSGYLARNLSRLWLREDSAVDAPITEPVVPLRVSARCLDGSGSWSAVLAEAACRSLGRGLRVNPDPGLFAGRVHGARWLVLVDALDEIPDPRLRRELIRSVAHHARSGSDYRFVVTTRVLPESELAPLRMPNVGSYVMEPFGELELKEFATKWFTVQQMPYPEAATESFLRQIADGRLSELVRNPLLATIAAVSAVKDPDRSLPASRISLYQRFCDYLIGGGSGKPDRLKQLRRHHEDNPELLTCVRWLHQNRGEILGVLARRWLESQANLWQAAVDWTRDRVPETVVLVEGWEQHLREELIGTGLLVTGERELRFLHQSFAEFLSARSHAEAIGNDFNELDAWIHRGLRRAERTFTLFTFAMWVDRQGHDIAIVIERLLSMLDLRRLLFAGWLMAEGISVPDHIAVHVIDRIVAFVRNCDDSDILDAGFKVLGALFDYPTLPTRLEELAGDPHIRLSCRVAALEALTRLQGGARAQPLLTQLLPSASGQDLHACAKIAVQLGQTAVDMTRQRALLMVREPGSGTDSTAKVAEVMRVLGLAAEVADLARSVLQEAKSTSWQLDQVVEAWLATHGASAVPEITALANNRPADDHAGRARLAAFLHKVGDDQAAESLASAVLDSDMVDSGAIADAIKTLLSVRGAAAVPQLLIVIDHWSERSSGEQIHYIGRALKQLAAYPEAAVATRARALVERFPGALGTHALINAWLAVEPAGDAILSLIDQGVALSISNQVWAANELQASGEFAAATKLAERVLRQRNDVYDFYYERAASVLLKVDRAAAVSQLVDWGKQDQKSEWLAGVMEAFLDADPEVEWAGVFCARKLVAHPRVDKKKLHFALECLLCLEGGLDAHSVAEAIRTRPELDFDQRRELTRLLAAVGQLDLAQSVWTCLLGWQGNTVDDDVGLIEDFLNAGVEQWAAERVRELIKDPATVPLRQQRLRQMLAWLTADRDANS